MNLQSVSPASARFALRGQLETCHERVERGFDHLDLTRLADYRRFLEVNAAALIPLETFVERAGVTELLPDWPDRTRRDALRADIQALGGDTTPLPVPALDPAPATVFGVLYVLEGSRLGARVLINTVARTRNRAVWAATHFLRHGADLPLWKTFLPALEATLSDPDNRYAALIGGRAAFGLFEHAQQSLLARVE